MPAKILVIGGGAAGMMAAITAARSGASVTLLEGGSQVGKKILSTGNGRCNFTNRKMDSVYYHSGDPSAVASVLARFGTEETLSFFRSLGIYAGDRGNYLYPRSEQAAAVREALEEELAALGVQVQTGQKVSRLTASREGFHVETSAGRRFQFSRVILAAGGKAAPKTGSDGSGCALAGTLGHHILPLVPALTALKIQEKALCQLWKNTRAKGTIRLLVNGTEAASDTGELQLTDYGVSGIPAFQVSRHAAYGLLEGAEVKAVLNFLPEFQPSELRSLKEEFSGSSRETGSFLRGLLPGRLADAVLDGIGCKRTAPCYSLKGSQKRRLWNLLEEMPLEVTGTLDFDAAQVTAGGVDLSEVNASTMESRLIPGLYFAGEILDVDGICGGYNLQWAWSSGYTAGLAAAVR